jgi:hypothetical protein
MKLKKLNEYFGGRWVSVHELDGFFFRKGYGYGQELGCNTEEGINNKNWAYENEEKGYIVNFKRHRKDSEGLTEVYISKKAIKFL